MSREAADIAQTLVIRTGLARVSDLGDIILREACGHASGGRGRAIVVVASVLVCDRFLPPALDEGGTGALVMQLSPVAEAAIDTQSRWWTCVDMRGSGVAQSEAALPVHNIPIPQVPKAIGDPERGPGLLHIDAVGSRRTALHGF